MTANPSEAPRQFGNVEANLRFIDATGVVQPARDVLEIGSGTGLLLNTLRARGCRARGEALRGVAGPGLQQTRFQRQALKGFAFSALHALPFGRKVV